MIYKEINQDFLDVLNKFRQGGYQIVATSGGFDPAHRGHIRCLLESCHITVTPTMLVVIVNGDGFLTRKKGKPFMCHEERMEIIDAIRGVEFVVGWDDGSQTVCGALELIKPDYFTKGGDRDSSASVPEFEVCERIGCEVVFGVGGEKIQSSSDLVKAAGKHLEETLLKMGGIS